MALSQGFHDRAREIVARYPQPRSALLMLLHAAQDEGGGHLTSDAIREVAGVLGLTAADVAGVASFYTMYKLRPVGKHLISLCTNLSCAINGADETAAKLAEIVGDGDEACSWEEVECLAWCARAPAAQVNYRDVSKLTPERAESLVAKLREGADAASVLEELNGG